MTQHAQHEGNGNKVGRVLKQYFCYHLVWILPMTAEQRNRWEKARAGGFLRYVLKGTLAIILTGTVVIGIMWLIVGTILDGEERHQADTYLLIPYSVVLLGGWIGPCFQWYHNEIEYAHRRR